MNDAADLSPEELAQRIAQLELANAAAEKRIHDRDSQLTELREKAVEAQREAETQEEKLGNTLLRRMDSLKRENSKLEQTLKTEEARNSAVVTQIASVRREKVDIENRIEVEQERMLNSLHKQLMDLSAEKAALEKQLCTGRAELLRALSSEIERLRSRTVSPTPQPADHASSSSASTPTASVTPVVKMELELKAMLHEAAVAQARSCVAENHVAELSDQLARLQNESFLSKARVAKLKADLERAQDDLALERDGSRSGTGTRHRRTPSTSSVDSLSSASSLNAVNMALAARDKEQVRLHTAKVLSSSPHLYAPAPTRDRSGSARRSRPTSPTS